jgi:NitT/TauT family transport system ATP-binding protein
VLLCDRIVVMTPRPGSVREILEVPLPRPRSLETLSDPNFHALANHIRGQLFTRRAA